jgi:hypothetical protein
MIAAIIELFGEGLSDRKISAQTGIPQTTVSYQKKDPAEGTPGATEGLQIKILKKFCSVWSRTVLCVLEGMKKNRSFQKGRCQT